LYPNGKIKLMTITVVPESEESGNARVRVFSRDKEASGATLGAAIDALGLSEEAWGSDGEPYILLRRFHPDRFFPEKQRTRLINLMAEWRVARDSNQPFPPELQSELESLIEAEQVATIARSQAPFAATHKGKLDLR
jgi:hypothetical protein